MLLHIEARARVKGGWVVVVVRSADNRTIKAWIAGTTPQLRAALERAAKYRRRLTED